MELLILITTAVALILLMSLLSRMSALEQKSNDLKGDLREILTLVRTQKREEHNNEILREIAAPAAAETTPAPEMQSDSIEEPIRKESPATGTEAVPPPLPKNTLSVREQPPVLNLPPQSRNPGNSKPPPGKFSAVSGTGSSSAKSTARKESPWNSPSRRPGFSVPAF